MSSNKYWLVVLSICLCSLVFRMVGVLTNSPRGPASVCEKTTLPQKETSREIVKRSCQFLKVLNILPEFLQCFDAQPSAWQRIQGLSDALDLCCHRRQEFIHDSHHGGHDNHAMGEAIPWARVHYGISRIRSFGCS